MANKVYEETHIKAIANAIRNKTGKTDSLLVRDMASEIDGISVGSGEGSSNPILQEITITKNGTYLPDEGYDGFSEVTVAFEYETDYPSVEEVEF